MREEPNLRRKIGWLAFWFSIGLLFMGVLRYSSLHPNLLTPLAPYATPGYVAVSVFFIIRFFRLKLSLNQLGFGHGMNLRQVILAASAVVTLQLLGPVLEEFLGGRDLERFSDIEGSVGALMGLLLLSWTFAAFGEELTYRIVLMRAISFTLGDSDRGKWIALAVQAVMFGLVHAYQGSAGIVGATISGLVYGTVTLAARGSIWPAAIAHGTNNTIGILEIYQG